ncbi:MAG: hypothetical protein ACE5G2_06360, partial [Candidatus Krumholzibacteriia bacterium]
MGVAHQYALTSNFADVLDVSANLGIRDADFRGLRQRTGSGNNSLTMQSRMSTELSKLIPTAGFTIPVSYTFSRNRSEPKFFSQSDTHALEVEWARGT